MSVYSITELPGRSFDVATVVSSQSRRHYQAIVTSPFDDEAAILTYGWSIAWPNSGSLPRPYVDALPTNPIMLCRGISGTQGNELGANGYATWNLTATFSSEPLTTFEQEQQVENPTERAAKIRWSSQQYQKAVDKDKNGDAIVNSAGDYFDPPPEIDRSYWTVTVQKNVASIPTWILNYNNPINSTGFSIQGLTVPARQAKIVAMDISELQTEGDFEYYVFTYAAQLNPAGWKLELLDQGLRYKSGSDRKNILDDNTPKQPVTTPKLLDGSGAVLSNPTSATAVFLTYYVYDELDFNDLPRA